MCKPSGFDRLLPNDDYHIAMKIWIVRESRDKVCSQLLVRQGGTFQSGGVELSGTFFPGLCRTALLKPSQQIFPLLLVNFFKQPELEL
jgi:hypothetical protein